MLFNRSFSRFGAGFLALFALLFCSPLFSQTGFFEAKKVESAALEGRLREHFSAFEIFKIDSRSLAEFAAKEPFFQLELKLEGQAAPLEMQLFPFDLRDEAFRFFVSTTEGIEEFPAPPCATFRGWKKDGSEVRATFLDGYLSFCIEAADGKSWWLEPAFRLDPSLAPGADLYVFYEKAAILPRSVTCLPLEIDREKARRRAPEKVETEAPERGSMPPMGCTVVRTCLAADASMYVKYGSNAATTLAHMTTVLNNVALDYDSDFDRAISFNVVASVVSTAAASPPESCWTASPSANDLLDAFTDWSQNTLGAPCNNPFGGTAHDEGLLWTNRDFTGSTVGLAWVGGICYDFGYNVLQDYTMTAGELRTMTAHEIGHNFSCNHVASSTIMNGGVQPGGSTAWDAINLAELNAHEGSDINCLTGADALQGSGMPHFLLPTTWCTNSGLPLFSNFRGSTSVSWAMPGGSPTSATGTTSSVSYVSAGSKAVTCTASSSNPTCPGSFARTKNVTIIATNGPTLPPTGTCLIAQNNTGTSGYFEMGIWGVAIPEAGFSATSLDGYQDGTAYLNRTCEQFATLTQLANTLTVTLDNNMTAPDNLQRLRAWIDYNNDGNFSDATERIANQTTATNGVLNFSFTVPVAGTVSNRVLRLRVATDGGTPSACTTPTFGQIEDYGVFVAAALLPVELVDFEAKKAEKGVNLIWQTASEINADRFEIERSADGERFVAIGKVAASGFSDAPLEYGFFDPAPFFGMNFYRLREVDFDGSGRESRVVAVDFGGLRPEAQAFPSPVGDGFFSVRFFAENESSEPAELQIFDQNGRLLATEKGAIEKGWNLLESSSAGLPSGFLTILLRLENATEVLRVRKI